MPLIIPAAPTPPNLSNPATFENDCSAFLAWFASVAGSMSGSALLVSDIIGTVSQSGGVPTGKLIESGSNANGDYLRLADGSQICVTTVSALSSGAVTWTFPMAFSAAPRSLPGAVGGSIGIPNTASQTSTTLAVSLYNASSVRINGFVGVLAWGRWF